MSRWSLQLVAAAAIVSAASADPRQPDSVSGGKVVFTQPSPKKPVGALASPYIYLNRCLGGCTITGGGTNDARTNSSVIPAAGQYVLTEFANSFGQTNATATKGTCLNPDGTTGAPVTTCTDDAG